MSFSDKLTDLYYFLKESNFSLEALDTESFIEYFNNLDTQGFVDAVYVYGQELRDLEFGSADDQVQQLLGLINEVRPKHTLDDLQQVKLNIGMINIYLYFCKRQNQDGLKSLKKNIDISVGFLREATKLTSETLEKSKGIFRYQVIKLFDYIFDIFQYYKVDNNNVPIDLDSFYVFTDQLDNDEIWEELSRQMKVKFANISSESKPGTIKMTEAEYEKRFQAAMSQVGPSVNIDVVDATKPNSDKPTPINSGLKNV